MPESWVIDFLIRYFSFSEQEAAAFLAMLQGGGEQMQELFTRYDQVRMTPHLPEQEPYLLAIHQMMLGQKSLQPSWFNLMNLLEFLRDEGKKPRNKEELLHECTQTMWHLIARDQKNAWPADAAEVIESALDKMTPVYAEVIRAHWALGRAKKETLAAIKRRLRRQLPYENVTAVLETARAEFRRALRSDPRSSALGFWVEAEVPEFVREEPPPIDQEQLVRMLRLPITRLDLPTEVHVVVARFCRHAWQIVSQPITIWRNRAHVSNRLTRKQLAALIAALEAKGIRFGMDLPQGAYPWNESK